MGVDVNLYAVGEISDELLARATNYIEARVRIAEAWCPGEGILVRSDGFDQPRVEMHTLARYYGEGYERGDWPAIYGAIRAMQTALPGLPVFYGGDSDDDGQECTPEFLEGVWRHWLGPDWDSYRREREAMTARWRLKI